MTVQCPNGHASNTDDFCDVCGEPIKGAPPASPLSPPRAPAAPASELSLDTPVTGATAPGPPIACPNCGDENPHDSLFCEACGYDFTTGQLPPAAASVPPAGVVWVAELWVDPDWFAAQEAAGSCATSGAPTIIPLRGAQALIGRRSKSRSLAPEIDCSADGSVSHTHAELTLDHDHWFVEDLGSTNGTYIGMPGDPLPTDPVEPHQRRELEDGQRIYVGAWCRIQIRRATDDEKTL
jgi:hypothetical protein